MARREQQQQQPRETESVLIRFYRDGGRNRNGERLQEVWGRSYAEWEHRHDFIQWLFPNLETSRFNPRAEVFTPDTLQEFRTDPIIRANLLQSYHAFLNFLGLYWKTMTTTSTTNATNNTSLSTLDSQQPSSHKKGGNRLRRLFSLPKVPKNASRAASPHQNSDTNQSSATTIATTTTTATVVVWRAHNFDERFATWGRVPPSRSRMAINHNWKRIIRVLKCLMLCEMQAEARALVHQLQSIYAQGYFGGSSFNNHDDDDDAPEQFAPSAIDTYYEVWNQSVQDPSSSYEEAATK